MTRSELVIECIRLFSVVALAACVLFVVLIWGSDSLQLYAVSDVIQVGLDASVIALIAAAGLQIFVAIPLWLYPKFRRSHG